MSPQMQFLPAIYGGPISYNLRNSMFFNFRSLVEESSLSLTRREVVCIFMFRGYLAILPVNSPWFSLPLFYMSFNPLFLGVLYILGIFTCRQELQLFFSQFFNLYFCFANGGFFFNYVELCFLCSQIYQSFLFMLLDFQSFLWKNFSNPRIYRNLPVFFLLLNFFLNFYI